MSSPARISYIFLVVTLVGVAWLDLATPLLTVLFSYFALRKLHVTRFRWLAIILFLVAVSGIFYGFVFFLQRAFDTLPQVAATAVPLIIKYAQSLHFELPFTDLESLKDLIITTLRSQLGHLGNFAKIATKEFAFLVIGCVVAISIFLNPKVDLSRESHDIRNNFYSLSCDQISERFRNFYLSFCTVMGAQIMISAINTLLTGIFLYAIALPYASVVIGVTFLCGLLPIIGNLISNSVIVAIAFTISPKMAVAALVFLVVLHKLEYFLNSKIIGDRIKNPVWLTLLGLILGERLMGIPGMILAPVVLHYIKSETSRMAVPEEQGEIDNRIELPPPAVMR